MRWRPAINRREGSRQVTPAGFIIAGCTLTALGCWGLVAPSLHMLSVVRGSGYVIFMLPAGIICIVVGVVQLLRRR